MTVKYEFSRTDCALFPYERDAYEAYNAIRAETEGRTEVWAALVGTIAKRKHDGMWVTAMIGDGWHSNNGRFKLSRHDAIMAGTGYATAWQAWKHRNDKHVKRS